MEKVDVKIMVEEGVEIPTYAKDGDAGFDIRANEIVIIQAGHRYAVKTGIKMAIPEGYELQIRPRSGLALKQGLTVLNTPGTIDSGYRGEICIILHNTSDVYRTICKGDRIAQGVLKRAPQANFIKVNELDETDRGEGGFGSTGVE